MTRARLSLSTRRFRIRLACLYFVKFHYPCQLSLNVYLPQVYPSTLNLIEQQPGTENVYPFLIKLVYSNFIRQVCLLSAETTAYKFHPVWVNKGVIQMSSCMGQQRCHISVILYGSAEVSYPKGIG